MGYRIGGTDGHAPDVDSVAFGSPGIAPKWTSGAKDAVGTAYSASSRVWFTMSRGVLTEIYYPTIDRPQVRDVEFLISDGQTFVHEEKKHLVHTIERIAPDALGYRVTSRDPDGRYALVKEIITDPHGATVLLRIHLEGDEDVLRTLHLYVLCASHLDGDGWGDSGLVTSYAGRQVLAAHGDRTWLMIAANVPFLKRSVGYVGKSDGWQDITQHKGMTWEFGSAPDGNIALCAELDLSGRREFTLGLAFGESDQNAASTLFQSLGHRWADHRPRFVRQWQRLGEGTVPLGESSGDGGDLFHASRMLLLAHEDKSYPGALIASLSIPWGDAKGDDDLGGYHLVWTRDMYNSSTGLLAAGNTSTPLRSLIYLACTQRADGGFYQNFWIDGRPYGTGIQLDETSAPIILAWRLDQLGILGNYDPFEMVMRAARYIIKEGPATQQERWEENAGYSPSTLASNITGLVCAADFAEKRGDLETSQFLYDYADFLESHVEAWTVTRNGELHPEIREHYIRINPVDPKDPHANESVDDAVVNIRNAAPGEPWQFAAKNIVDAGFLELVRFGIRRPGDAIIEQSLSVIDHVLKVETPLGPAWHRYNHDGYGERKDGSAFEGHGIGRAWPLLTGERGHYEFAAGRDVTPYLRALEQFSNEVGLLPEQVWDEADRPRQRFQFGKPTGSAMPLMWAHAEYLKLLRSKHDGRVFDRNPLVAARYADNDRGRRNLEIWKFNRQIKSMFGGRTLRVVAVTPFRLRITIDDWANATDFESKTTNFGLHWVDVDTHPNQRGPCVFTFLWTDTDKWEGTDFRVDVIEDPTV